MRRFLLSSVAVAGLLGMSGGTVLASDPYWQSTPNGTVVRSYPAVPTYVAPAPGPVYVYPEPVYRPAPVYYQPAPVYYGGSYYSGPFVGVHSGPFGGGVRVGPLHFGWR